MIVTQADLRGKTHELSNNLGQLINPYLSGGPFNSSWYYTTEQGAIIMPCRIGITTDLVAQKAYWESNSNNLQNWQVIAGPFSSRTDAQEEAIRLAANTNCDSTTSGSISDTPGAEWWVYRFTHDGWN